MTQQGDTVTDPPNVFISYRRDEPGNYPAKAATSSRPAGATLPPPYAH
jgi:hypothetical protein